MAHLIGTESILAGEDTPHVDIDVHALGHVHNEIGALNERWVESLRGTPAPVSSTGTGGSCRVATTSSRR